MRNPIAAHLPRFSPMARWAAASVLLVAAVVVASTAYGQGMRGGDGPGMMMFGGPPHQIGRMVDHMLDGLNATEAQRTQIKQIVLAASADLRAQRESSRGLRDKGMQIFAAQTVDAGAAEALRQQMLTQHDQSSKRVLQAMLDISKVLTPEQRAMIGSRMAQHQAIMQERMQREHGPDRSQK
jgi:Spy/CpxP family protein refolding chaperone